MKIWLRGGQTVHVKKGAKVETKEGLVVVRNSRGTDLVFFTPAAVAGWADDKVEIETSGFWEGEPSALQKALAEQAA